MIEIPYRQSKDGTKNYASVRFHRGKVRVRMSACPHVRMSAGPQYPHTLPTPMASTCVHMRPHASEGFHMRPHASTCFRGLPPHLYVAAPPTGQADVNILAGLYGTVALMVGIKETLEFGVVAKLQLLANLMGRFAPHCADGTSSCDRLDFTGKVQLQLPFTVRPLHQTNTWPRRTPP